VSGIAGIATTHPKESLRPAADRMAASMKHRGPDSQGVQEFASCVLVNARLSIIDLSDRGYMPMSSPDGQTWITYNGESYKAGELRAELEMALGRRDYPKVGCGATFR
jgi:asparagine synthase (glutamine-hydrolysing)